VDKVSGPTCRSIGLLVGWVHLAGTSGTLVGGAHGYPCLTSPRLTCRRSGSDKVTSKQSEDVVAMKSQRVCGDPKRKILLGAYKDEH
jgi:hypothetical protein